MELEVWSYFDKDINSLGQQITDLINRGGKIKNLAIAYGPSPARVAGHPWADAENWQAIVIVDTSEINPDL